MRSSGWSAFPPEKLAFAIAYVENNYSHVKTADALGLTYRDAYRLEREPLVLACVQDLQSQIEGIDVLNEKWVDAKIREMMPMVMGEIDVPMVDMKSGEQFTAKKFMPEIAARLLELKSPSKNSAKVQVNVVNGETRLENLADRLVGLMRDRQSRTVESTATEVP